MTFEGLSSCDLIGVEVQSLQVRSMDLGNCCQLVRREISNLEELERFFLCSKEVNICDLIFTRVDCEDVW